MPSIPRASPPSCDINPGCLLSTPTSTSDSELACACGNSFPYKSCATVQQFCHRYIAYVIFRLATSSTGPWEERVKKGSLSCSRFSGRNQTVRCIYRPQSYHWVYFQVDITPILNPLHETMVEEKGKMFVFEVFLNLNEILAHHRRTLRSLFARQWDQHPLFHSVVDFIRLLQGIHVVFSDRTEHQESYIKHLPLSLERIRRNWTETLSRKTRCSEDP